MPSYILGLLLTVRNYIYNFPFVSLAVYVDIDVKRLGMDFSGHSR